jgi:Curli production assembly/transport component CsgG/Short C-terminal domain
VNPRQFFRRGVIVLCLASTISALYAESQPASPPPQAPPANTSMDPPRIVPLVDDLPRITRSERYSAQRKPRIAVLDFEDTNKDAIDTLYRDAVEAMLVTFLKRKSQFVVVERQKIGDVQKEWKLARTGQTSQAPGATETFEALDAILVGSVTLLDAPSSVEKVGEKSSSSSGQNVQRIEVDVKALARADGRIIAAAQSSGPIPCLRSIVERLGVALEQEFLRPYYGTLRVQLSAPENVRVLLTPILLDQAVDEEKPPVERGETVIRGKKNDEIEPWATNPTTYTIENLLAGWYMLRLERPGYHALSLASGNEDLVARKVGDQVYIEYQPPAPLTEGARTNLAPVRLQQAPASVQRFVVYVAPRTTRLLDGDRRRLDFSKSKKVGSLTPLAWRGILDHDFTHTPKRVFLIGKETLEINNKKELEEFAEDTTCDLFKEKPPERKNYGRTVIAQGQQFDVETFLGGDLIIEDYKGEPLPVGTYQIAFWEPDYELYQSTVVVNTGDDRRPFEAVLTRKSGSVQLATAGPRRPHDVFLAGESTGTKVEVPLDFGSLKEYGLPVDRYTASTNIPGLRGWRSAVDLGTSPVPPFYDEKRDEELTRLQREAKARQDEQEKQAANQVAPAKEKIDDQQKVVMPLTFPVGPGGPPPVLSIKTHLAVGGRTSALSSTAPLTSEAVHVDPEIAQYLDAALWIVRDKASKPRRRWWGGSKSTAGTPPDQASTSAPAMDATPARSLLLQRLRDLDLVILDDDDMASAKDSPDIARAIRQYVEAGGTLFAFVSEPGDYSDVVGAPLNVELKGRRSAKFQIAEGTVAEVVLRLAEKRVKVRSKRKLPSLQSGLDSSWRVMAFTTEGKEPRIIERGQREQGGYVAVWLDRPALFRTRLLGRPVIDIERSRAKVESHVVDWANALMARRYDTQPSQIAQTTQTVSNSEGRLKQLKQLLDQGLISKEEYETKRDEILRSL